MNHEYLKKVLGIIKKHNTSLDLSQISVGGLEMDLNGIEAVGEEKPSGFEVSLRSFSIEGASDYANFNSPGILKANTKLPFVTKEMGEELCDLYFEIYEDSRLVVDLDDFFEFMNKEVSQDLIYESMKLNSLDELNKTKFFKLVMQFGKVDRPTHVHMYSLMRHLQLLTIEEEIIINRGITHLRSSYAEDYQWLSDILKKVKPNFDKLKPFRIIVEQGNSREVIGEVNEYTLSKVRTLVNNYGNENGNGNSFSSTSVF